MERAICMIFFIIHLALCLNLTFAHLTPTTNGTITCNQNHSSIAPAAPDLGLIDKVCQNASLYKDFCISTLKSRSKGQILDLKGLAFLSVKLLRRQAAANFALDATKLYCPDDYSSALYSLNESMRAFSTNSRSAMDIRDSVQESIGFLDACWVRLNAHGKLGANADMSQVISKLSFTATSVVSAWAADHKAAATTTSLIEKACHGASYDKFCVSTLKSRPEAQELDLRGLAMLAVKMIKEQVEANAALTTAKLHCKAQYSEVLKTANDVINALSSDETAADAGFTMIERLQSMYPHITSCQQTLRVALQGVAMQKNMVLQQLVGSASSAVSACIMD